KTFMKLVVDLSEWKELDSLLQSLEFIEACFRSKLESELLSLYTLARSELEHPTESKKKQKKKFALSESVGDFERFVSENGHFLAKFPSLVLQQALNQPASSAVYMQAQQAFSSQQEAKRLSLVLWLNKPLTRSACVRSMQFSKCITAVTVSPEEKLIAIG